MSTQTVDQNRSIRSVSVVNNQIDSKELFECTRQLCILHNGSEYKLQLTGNGKLILTK
ncbi:hemin uptake protein HemP [Sneathiella glossodoripedis]|uniref:hemin uptake protein HemP n=1 Tax=Sneathiella glossodoripedis TaxID=418853 RepID=UPI0009FCC916